MLKFVFKYRDVGKYSRFNCDTCTNTQYVEYDNTIIYAKNKEDAWRIFLGMDGAFGLPDERDYFLEQN